MRHNFQAIHILGKYSCRAIYTDRQSWTIFVLFDSFAQMTLDGELKICSFSRTEQISNELARNLQLTLLRKIYGSGLSWSLWIARKVELSKAMPIFWDKSHVWVFKKNKGLPALKNTTQIENHRERREGGPEKREPKKKLVTCTLQEPNIQGKVLEEAHIFGLSFQTQTNKKRKARNFYWTQTQPSFYNWAWFTLLS